MLKALRIPNSNILILEAFFVLLPIRDTLEMTRLIADFQCKCLP